MKPKEPWDDFVIQNGRRVPRIHAEIANELERTWKIKPDNIIYSHSSDRVSADFGLMIDPVELADLQEPNAKGDRVATAHYVGRRMMEDEEDEEDEDVEGPPYSIQLDLNLTTGVRIEVEARNRHSSLAQEVESSFRFVDLLVPKRLSNEEIGDAVESINRMLTDPACKPWKIWLKVATTWFWIAINGVRNFTSAFMGKKAE